MAKAKKEEAAVPSDWGTKKAEVTFKEVEDHLKKLFAAEAIRKELEGQLELAQKKVTELKLAADKYLEALDKKSYKIEGLGSISRTQRFSVKVPEREEDRVLFLKYCAKKGMKLSEYAFPGSKWLNAFVAEEFEAAKSKGLDQFKIPGIEMGEAYVTLSIRLEK